MMQLFGVLFVMLLCSQLSLSKIAFESIVPTTEQPQKLLNCLKQNDTDTLAFNECFVEYNYTATANYGFHQKMLQCQESKFVRRSIQIAAFIHKNLKWFDEQGYFDLFTSLYQLGEMNDVLANCLKDYDETALRDACYLCSDEYLKFMNFYEYWLRQPYDWGYDQLLSNVTMFEKIMTDPILPDLSLMDNMVHLFLCFVCVVTAADFI